MVTIDAVVVDPTDDDPASTPGGPALGQAHDGARRLRRCSAVSSSEEAARLLLVVRLKAAREGPHKSRHSPSRAARTWICPKAKDDDSRSTRLAPARARRAATHRSDALLRPALTFVSGLRALDRWERRRRAAPIHGSHRTRGSGKARHTCR